MIRSYLKCAVARKSIYLDSWIILLSSFVVSFVMTFTFSMARSLVMADRLLLNPDMVIGGDLDSAQLEFLNGMREDGTLRSCDLVGDLFGILETKGNFAVARVKEVEADYFSKERLRLLGIGNLAPKDAGIVVSSSMARALLVGKGDRIAFIDSASGRAVMNDVIAVFETGLSSFDEQVAFLVNGNESRNGKGRDKIFAASRSYEMVFSRGVSIRLFGKSSFGEIDPDMARRIYESALADKARIPRRSANQITSSIDSVRFILLLFVVLSLCYVSAFVRNFERRNSHVTRVYAILGCPRLRLLESMALYCVIAISFLTGVGAGIVFCALFKNALSLLDGSGILALDYYMLKFPISVNWTDLGICALALYCVLAVCRLAGSAADNIRERRLASKP